MREVVIASVFRTLRHFTQRRFGRSDAKFRLTNTILKRGQRARVPHLSQHHIHSDQAV
jgi:hypothetical protein